EPAEKRHRAVQVVVGDGVEAARTLEEGEIVGHQAADKKQGPEASGDFLAGVQEMNIATQAEQIGYGGEDDIEVMHFALPGALKIHYSPGRERVPEGTCEGVGRIPAWRMLDSRRARRTRKRWYESCALSPIRASGSCSDRGRGETRSSG